MKTRNLLLALGCAAALTACTTNDEPAVAPAPAMRTVTLSVDVNEPADTRVEYGKEGTTYKFAWSVNDELQVYYNYDGIEVVLPFKIVNSSIDGKKAVFSGSLPDDFFGDVTIVYVGTDIRLNSDGSYGLTGYTGQTTDVAKDLAARTLLAATAYVPAGEHGALPNVTLNHALSYLLLKAGLQVTQEDLTYLKNEPDLIFVFNVPNKVSFNSEGYETSSSGSTFGSINVIDGKLYKPCLVPIFVGSDGQNKFLEVEGHLNGSDSGTITKQPESLYEPGKIYVVEADNEKWQPVTVAGVTEPDLGEPLTVESLDDGNTIKIKNPLKLPIQYKVEGGSVVTTTEDATISVGKGSKVQFWGDNPAYSNGISAGYVHTSITSTGDIKIYGNIMSLIDSDEFSKLKELTEPYTFKGLFATDGESGNPYLTDASGLVLPATTLTDFCYYDMFYDCKGMIKAPALLPAKTLAESCYENMFKYCHKLEGAPALPATTLAKSCYKNMFNQCHVLKDVPAKLPATTLEARCYERMFTDCIALETAPELPAITLAADCYTFMFNKCLLLEKAPELPAETLVNYCYYGMFFGCASLTEAPVLPAKKLEPYCYDQMFSDCSNLSSVTCLANDIGAIYCTNEWLKGVAANGTFYRYLGFSGWGSGDSDIPDGWKVKNYGE